MIFPISLKLPGKTEPLRASNFRSPWATINSRLETYHLTYFSWNISWAMDSSPWLEGHLCFKKRISMQRMYQQKSFSCVIWGVQVIKQQFHTLHHIKIFLSHFRTRFSLCSACKYVLTQELQKPFKNPLQNGCEILWIGMLKQLFFSKVWGLTGPHLGLFRI